VGARLGLSAGILGGVARLNIQPYVRVSDINLETNELLVISPLSQAIQVYQGKEACQKQRLNKAFAPLQRSLAIS